MDKFLSILGIGSVGAFIGILLFYSPVSPDATLEAQSPQRLQLESKDKVGDFTTEIRCDIRTGNLQYLTYQQVSGLVGPLPHSGVVQSIITNGCAKNSR